MLNQPNPFGDNAKKNIINAATQAGEKFNKYKESGQMEADAQKIQKTAQDLANPIVNVATDIKDKAIEYKESGKMQTDLDNVKTSVEKFSKTDRAKEIAAALGAGALALLLSGQGAKLVEMASKANALNEEVNSTKATMVQKEQRYEQAKKEVNEAANSGWFGDKSVVDGYKEIINKAQEDTRKRFPNADYSQSDEISKKINESFKDFNAPDSMGRAMTMNSDVNAVKETLGERFAEKQDIVKTKLIESDSAQQDAKMAKENYESISNNDTLISANIEKDKAQNDAATTFIVGGLGGGFAFKKYKDSQKEKEKDEPNPEPNPEPTTDTDQPTIEKKMEVTNNSDILSEVVTLPDAQPIEEIAQAPITTTETNSNIQENGIFESSQNVVLKEESTPSIPLNNNSEEELNFITPTDEAIEPVPTIETNLEQIEPIVEPAIEIDPEPIVEPIPTLSTKTDNVKKETLLGKAGKIASRLAMGAALSYGGLNIAEANSSYNKPLSTETINDQPTLVSQVSDKVVDTKNFVQAQGTKAFETINNQLQKDNTIEFQTKKVNYIKNELKATLANNTQAIESIGNNPSANTGSQNRRLDNFKLENLIIQHIIDNLKVGENNVPIPQELVEQVNNSSTARETIKQFVANGKFDLNSLLPDSEFKSKLNESVTTENTSNNPTTESQVTTSTPETSTAPEPTPTAEVTPTAETTPTPVQTPEVPTIQPINNNVPEADNPKPAVETAKVIPRVEPHPNAYTEPNPDYTNAKNKIDAFAQQSGLGAKINDYNLKLAQEMITNMTATLEQKGDTMDTASKEVLIAKINSWKYIQSHITPGTIYIPIAQSAIPTIEKAMSGNPESIFTKIRFGNLNGVDIANKNFDGAGTLGGSTPSLQSDLNRLAELRK